jgi:hypothetical protein
MHDSLAFFCSSKKVDSTGILSNFIYYNRNPFYISRFMIDYNPDTTPFTDLVLIKLRQFIKCDLEGSIFVEFDLLGDIQQRVT